MPDTVRTLAALQALLADNVAGDISAQDVRDFLVSVYPTEVGVQVKRTAGQSINTGTETAINFTAENFDTDGFHDNAVNNERLTVPAGLGGVYLVSAQVGWSTSTIARYTARLYKNGSTFATMVGYVDMDDLVAIGQQVMAIIPMDATDFIGLYVFHDNGVATDTTFSSDLSTSMTMYRIAGSGV